MSFLSTDYRGCAVQWPVKSVALSTGKPRGCRLVNFDTNHFSATSQGKTSLGFCILCLGQEPLAKSALGAHNH